MTVYALEKIFWYMQSSQLA